jgi:hypothetical protein
VLMLYLLLPQIMLIFIYSGSFQFGDSLLNFDLHV